MAVTRRVRKSHRLYCKKGRMPNVVPVVEEGRRRIEQGVRRKRGYIELLHLFSITTLVTGTKS